jgi:anti-anti-sigma regulatory factor
MLRICMENIGDMAVVQCAGRIVHSDTVFQLRDAVKSQRNATTVILDLTEVSALGGGGVGMLAFLQRWAHDHDIQFKLFNPSLSTRHRLEQASSMHEFEIANLFEMTTLLTIAEHQEALASITAPQAQHSVA